VLGLELLVAPARAWARRSGRRRNFRAIEINDKSSATRTKRWLMKKCATKQMHGIHATAQQKRSMERDEKKENNQRDTTV
jgi:hypothetical protein